MALSLGEDMGEYFLRTSLYITGGAQVGAGGVFWNTESWTHQTFTASNRHSANSRAKE